MWLLIQDNRDPLVKRVGFKERIASEKKGKGQIIWTFLPTDFGTPEYAIRRKENIRNHINGLSNNKDELLWTFDYWIGYSEELRQYLWAHNKENVEKARRIVEILPIHIVKKILMYLITNYWDRFCGWPDLFVYNDTQYFFVEVKFSKDKLSEDQKNWIKGNNNELQLPFKLLKIHKTNEAK